MSLAVSNTVSHEHHTSTLNLTDLANSESHNLHKFKYPQVLEERGSHVSFVQLLPRGSSFDLFFFIKSFHSFIFNTYKTMPKRPKKFREHPSFCTWDFQSHLA